MKRILIIYFTCFIINFSFGQKEIKLIPIEHQSKIKIEKSENSNEYFSDRNLIYSDNELNAVTIKVNPPDEQKEEKAQNKIVSLYDHEGKYLASSEPYDLYDWVVKPMGDNETVLVIFPAGTARKAIIKILKKENQKLKEIHEIRKETAYFNIKADPNGETFLTSYSTFESIREFPEFVLYNNHGQELWTFKIKDEVAYSMLVLNDYIIVTSKNRSVKSGNIYVLDHTGNITMKSHIENSAGNYTLKASNDKTNRYFALSTISGINLFDHSTLTEIKKFTLTDSNSKIKSYEVDITGNIIAATKTKIIVESIQEQRQEIKIDYCQNPKVNKRNDKVIIEMWNPKQSKYYEINY